MTSSPKNNNTKSQTCLVLGEGQGMAENNANSSSSQNNILKFDCKNIIFSFSSKSEKFELSNRSHIPFIIDKIKNFILEWNEGEKEIYIEGRFYKNNKIYLPQINKKTFNYFRFNSNLINVLNGIIFKAEGNSEISSIYIINNPNSKSNKIKDNFQNKFSNNNKIKESSLIAVAKTKHQIKNDIIIDFNFSKKNYCNYIPKRKEMRDTAGKKPSHFPMECFHGINQIHNEIGDKEYCTLTNKNIFNSNNDSYKNIDRKEHFLLNHLCQKNIYSKLIHSFTVRYRHKNATFVYYK